MEKLKQIEQCMDIIIDCLELTNQAEVDLDVLDDSLNNLLLCLQELRECELEYDEEELNGEEQETPRELPKTIH